MLRRKTFLETREKTIYWPIFGFFLSNNSSKERLIELKFWSQVVLIAVQMPCKAFWRTQIFTVTELTQNLIFWSNFDSNLAPKDGRNQKESSGYPSQPKSRPYLLSIFNKNYNYLRYWAFFGYKWAHGERSSCNSLS